MIAGTCRYCVCTDAVGCEAGCSWTDDTQTLCSLCQDAEDLAQKVVDLFGRVGPMLRPPAALPAPAWADLIFEQQQVLVMAHRRIVEATRETLIEEVSEDAIGAMVACRSLAKFLTSHCPQHLEGDEPIEDVVIRLLEPHVGSRIVMPGSATA